MFNICFLLDLLQLTIINNTGFAVAGGSDIALCCDIIVMANNAKVRQGTTLEKGSRE